MDNGFYELPPPPELNEVAAEPGRNGETKREQLEALFLEIEYRLNADFIVDRLIAQAHSHRA